MRTNKRGLLIIFTLVISTVLISACTQSLSNAPIATPTLIPPGEFVQPLPSAENPMAMIEEFGKQTQAAQTTVANGGTPVAPQAITTGTVITPQAGGAATATPIVAVPSTPTNAAAVIATTTPIVASGPTAAAVPPGTVPQVYVLREGEWPYCIARRFDVDPDALIKASGLINPDIYYAGLELKIPQGSAFPEPRVLMAHPTNYTVLSGDSFYSIACAFGDVYPENIASANGLSTSAKLNVGQVIKIP